MYTCTYIYINSYSYICIYIIYIYMCIYIYVYVYIYVYIKLEREVGWHARLKKQAEKRTCNACASCQLFSFDSLSALPSTTFNLCRQTWFVIHNGKYQWHLRRKWRKRHTYENRMGPDRVRKGREGGNQTSWMSDEPRPSRPRYIWCQTRVETVFRGRELTFFRKTQQGEGRECWKETEFGRGLGSWDMWATARLSWYHIRALGRENALQDPGLTALAPLRSRRCRAPSLDPWVESWEHEFDISYLQLQPRHRK